MLLDYNLKIIEFAARLCNIEINSPLYELGFRNGRFAKIRDNGGITYIRNSKGLWIKAVDRRPTKELNLFCI